MRKKFREAFLEALETRDTNVAQIARDAKVSKDMLNKLKQGKTLSINVDDAIAVAGAFDQTVNEFIGETRKSLSDELTRQIEQLSDRERTVLAASLTTLRDPQSIGKLTLDQDANAKPATATRTIDQAE